VAAWQLSSVLLALATQVDADPDWSTRMPPGWSELLRHVAELFAAHAVEAIGYVTPDR
jgi:hypothetical protein